MASLVDTERIWRMLVSEELRPTEKQYFGDDFGRYVFRLWFQDSGTTFEYCFTEREFVEMEQWPR